MVYIIIFLIIIFFVFLISIGAIFIKIHKRKVLNESVLLKLKENGFESSKIFYLADQMSVNNVKIMQLVLVDQAKEKLALIDYLERDFKIVSFSTISDFEVLSNENLVTEGTYKGKRNKIVYNGQQSSVCTSFKLIIRLDDVNCPQIEYSLINKEFGYIPIKKDSQKYEIIMSSVQKLISFLEILKKRKD